MTAQGQALSPEDMDRARKEVEQAMDGIMSANRKLQSDIGLLEPHWSGRAASKFHLVLNEWFQQSGDLQQVLAGFGDGFKSTAATFHSADTAASSNISKAAGSLGGSI